MEKCVSWDHLSHRLKRFRFWRLFCWVSDKITRTSWWNSWKKTPPLPAHIGARKFSTTVRSRKKHLAAYDRISGSKSKYSIFSQKPKFKYGHGYWEGWTESPEVGLPPPSLCREIWCYEYIFGKLLYFASPCIEFCLAWGDARHCEEILLVLFKGPGESKEWGRNSERWFLESSRRRHREKIIIEVFRLHVWHFFPHIVFWRGGGGTYAYEIWRTRHHIVREWKSESGKRNRIEETPGAPQAFTIQSRLSR